MKNIIPLISVFFVMIVILWTTNKKTLFWFLLLIFISGMIYQLNKHRIYYIGGN